MVTQKKGHKVSVKEYESYELFIDQDNIVYFTFSKSSVVNERIFIFFSLIHGIVLYSSIVKNRVQKPKHRNGCPMPIAFLFERIIQSYI